MNEHTSITLTDIHKASKVHGTPLMSPRISSPSVSVQSGHRGPSFSDCTARGSKTSEVSALRFGSGFLVAAATQSGETR